METTSSSRMVIRQVLEIALFFHKDNRKDSFPPPNRHRHNALGPGVLGVQKKGAGRGKGNHGSASGELGLEEGGTNDDDDPDI